MGPEASVADAASAAAGASREQLYDEYLDAVLDGRIESPRSFVARHGHADEALLAQLEAVYRVAEAPVADSSDDAPRLDRLGEFRALELLGRGGMGVVYLARQDTLDRQVALKVIRPECARSATAVARFEREAKAVARLRHANIVNVYTVGQDRGVRYIAMEFVPGRTLSTVIDEAVADHEPLPVPTVLRWVAQLARALHYAHQEGIIHRDVKPSNIRITPEGRPLLLDFGLAHELDPGAATLTEGFVGSPHYCAPEQIGRAGGAVDGRTDVYALGIVLYQCLTGRVPFAEGSIEQILRSILVDDPPRLRGIVRSLPRDIEVVCGKALEKDPDRRYHSAGDFADDLEAVLEFRPIQARPPWVVTRALKCARRNPWKVAGATAATVAVMAVAGVLWGQAHARADGRRAEALGAVTVARDKLREYRRLQRTADNASLTRTLMDPRYLSPTEYGVLDGTDAGTVRLQMQALLADAEDLLAHGRRLDPDLRIARDLLFDVYEEKWRRAGAVTAGTSTRVPARLFTTSLQNSYSTHEVFRYAVSGPDDAPSLELTLKGPSLDHPWGIAFSDAGEMFVVNRGPDTYREGATRMQGSVVRFLDPAGSPVLNGMIRSNDFDLPHGAAFWKGELFVVQGYGRNVLRFIIDSEGSVTANGLITRGIDSPLSTCAGNPATGELLVAQFRPGLHCYELDAGGEAIGYKLIGQSPTVANGIVFSPWGELFTSNFGSNTVSRFVFDSAGNAWPNGVMTGNGLSAPIGVDFSPWGELFVANMRSARISRWVFDDSHNAIPNGTFPTPETLADLKFIPCPADLDGDLDVGTADLLLLLGGWGTSPGRPPDLNDDGRVGAADVLVLLARWGPCW